MIASRATPLILALAFAMAGATAGHAASATAPSLPAARQPADLAGTWELSIAGTGESCRILLRPGASGAGANVLGMTPACRHAMPDLAKVEGWTLPDPSHLALADTAGNPVLVLAAAGEVFSAALGNQAYILREIAATGRSAASFAPVDPMSSPGFAEIAPVSKRSKAAVADEMPSELGGRYAVMREKHDTGCMLTLDDKTRVKGGDRAQLAPGCRDQGIVIFDPTAWTVIKGELVLTARAGHKAHLVKSGEGAWQKDTKDGSKPLGLKKL